MTDLETLPAWAGRQSTDPDPDPSGDGGGSSPRSRLVLLAGIAVVAAGAAIGAVIATDGGSSGGDTSATTIGVTTIPAVDEATTVVSATVGATTAPGDGETPVLGVSEPVVAARLDDYALVIQGTVDDEAAIDAVVATLAAEYGTLGTSSLALDPEAPPTPWAAALAPVLSQFTGLIDGELVVSVDATTITGRAPDEATRQAVVDTLAPTNGFPPLDADDLVVVDLPPAEITAAARDGILELGGVVPSDALRRNLVTAAIELYGDGNVVDDITVDPGTGARFNLSRFGTWLALFQSAATFDVGVSGDSFFGVLDSGITFRNGSAELAPEATGLLGDFAAIMDRSTFQIDVEGHTDDVGPDDVNLVLSEARARSVADFLIARGIEESRLVVVGRGESEPAVPNDSEVNRAANRRVVLRMSYDG
ncbi:MAG: OmpA family protein [Acidimicrobiales bacterium]